MPLFVINIFWHVIQQFQKQNCDHTRFLFIFKKCIFFIIGTNSTTSKNKSLSGRLQISWCGTTQLYFLFEHGNIIASIILVNVKILSCQFLGQNVQGQFRFKNIIQENAKRFDHRRAHNHKFQLLRIPLRLFFSPWNSKVATGKHGSKCKKVECCNKRKTTYNLKICSQKFTRKCPPERGFKIKMGPNRESNLFTTESELVIINKHRAYSGVHFVKRSVVLDWDLWRTPP